MVEILALSGGRSSSDAFASDRLKPRGEAVEQCASRLAVVYLVSDRGEADGSAPSSANTK